MSQQEDDLERRVLAHELDVLIAQMSETEPKLLARFRNLFTHGRHPKRSEPDRAETDAYAERSIQPVTRLSDEASSKHH
jgi:hypothetical protein